MLPWWRDCACNGRIGERPDFVARRDSPGMSRNRPTRRRLPRTSPGLGLIQNHGQLLRRVFPRRRARQHELAPTQTDPLQWHRLDCTRLAGSIQSAKRKTHRPLRVPRLSPCSYWRLFPTPVAFRCSSLSSRGRCWTGERLASGLSARVRCGAKKQLTIFAHVSQATTGPIARPCCPLSHVHANSNIGPLQARSQARSESCIVCGLAVKMRTAQLSPVTSRNVRHMYAAVASWRGFWCAPQALACRMEQENSRACLVSWCPMKTLDR